MAEKSGRKELEGSLEQARRTAAGLTNPATLERITRLIRDLGEPLE